MAWIKRNLYFVITVVAGLGVTGYCCFLLVTAMNKTSENRENYAKDFSTLKTLTNEDPYPNEPNIREVTNDQERVRQFLANFRKEFADFPTPPKLDAHSFKNYLQKTINEFTQEATNAGVGIITNYAFSFQGQMDKLSPSPECIDPWMQQLEEIKAILQILFDAKINYLQNIKRPAVPPDDIGNSDDYIPQGNVTNQWGVVTPYKVEFRGFSAELAAVLAGFAHSSNCFIVKMPIVVQSKAPLEPLAPLSPTTMPPTQNPQRPMSRPQSNPFGPPGRFGRGFGSRLGPGPLAAPGVAAPTAATGPEKILSEQLLFITLYVDVVKLKAPTAPKPTPVPKVVKPATITQP